MLALSPALPSCCDQNHDYHHYHYCYHTAAIVTAISTITNTNTAFPGTSMITPSIDTTAIAIPDHSTITV